jgi:hypothetical protein
VEARLEFKSKIEERIRNVPEANRERAFINAAKTEAMNQTVRPAGKSVRPSLSGIPGRRVLRCPPPLLFGVRVVAGFGALRGGGL